MLFNSLIFPVFFVLVYASYWALKKSIRSQNILLLVASYFFYGWWDVRFLTLISLSTIIDHFCAQSICTGAIPFKQRLKTTAFAIATFIAFLAFDWSAIDLSLSRPFFTLEWVEFIKPSTTNKNYILLLTLLLLSFNALYSLAFRLSENKRKKFFVTFSIIANLSILGVFKYFNFFADSLNAFAESVFGTQLGNTTLNIVLPVGISFYTFQTMSYTIDVYRGRMKACPSLLDFATYVSFFPQLVAGPIERGTHLVPQFQKHRSVSKEQFQSGLWLILWGFFKKTVIADNVAKITNTSFAPWDSIVTGSGGLIPPSDGITTLFAVYAFAIQIYCDFSGYSDIARGTAKLLGFDLMLNFNLPYFSRSPSEFWQRWHISLSSWLRDYLYIPLGGNRNGNLAMYRNLMLTMILGGLWHGASWTFVLWGIYQGGILVIYRLVAPNTDKSPNRRLIHLAQWFVMFHITCLGWLIFRARNLETIWDFLTSILFNFTYSSQTIDAFQSLVFYTWPLIALQLIQYFKNDLEPIKNWPLFARINIYLFLLFGIAALAERNSQGFIYFAF